MIWYVRETGLCLCLCLCPTIPCYAMLCYTYFFGPCLCVCVSVCLSVCLSAGCMQGVGVSSVRSFIGGVCGIIIIIECSMHACYSYPLFSFFLFSSFYSFLFPRSNLVYDYIQIYIHIHKYEYVHIRPLMCILFLVSGREAAFSSSSSCLALGPRAVRGLTN